MPILIGTHYPDFSLQDNPLNEPIDAYFKQGGNVSSYIDTKLAEISSLLEPLDASASAEPPE